MLDFELNDEQRLIRDSVERFVERSYTFDIRQKAVESEEGFSRGTWREFADLGWLSIGIPADAGGVDGGAQDVALIMEGIGRGLVAEPFLSCIVMAAKAVTLAGNAAQHREILGPVMAGEHLISLAWSEARSRYNPAVVETAARETPSGWTLNGTKNLVLHGASADRLIVSARTAGSANDRNGIALFVVNSDADGLSTRGYPTNDGGRAAEVELHDVHVSHDDLLGSQSSAISVLEEVIDRATAAVCAESLGLMEVLNEMTRDYAKTRVQFGKPIASFQALQHRMVEMFVALEESRSLTTVYMGDVDSDSLTERQSAVSAMKVQCDKAGRKVGQEAVQLHGGIAMTAEYAASHYFKRLSMIHRTFGDVDWHLDRFSRAGVAL